MEAIDKLRAMVSWADYQNEYFNQRFKSIEAIEKAYDFVQSHRSIEFLDDLSDFDAEERKEVKELLKDLLI